MKTKTPRTKPKNPAGCDPKKGGITGCGYKKGGSVKKMNCGGKVKKMKSGGKVKKKSC